MNKHPIQPLENKESNHPLILDQGACVTVEFLCDDCGKFEVIKTKSTLVQFCGCGKESKPIRIISAAINLDGKWVNRPMLNTK
jgi:hypothetical protein